MDNQFRVYYPFVGPFDPCPPMKVKTYVVPPNQFIVYQPMNLPQFPLHEALKLGTLWPALYSPYYSKGKEGMTGEYYAG
ncbi:spore coat associated protein CotJA [Paenibacillus tarimensis]